MLQSVYIENIALIKRLSLEPQGGFCAFTGETGAGKSIIIDALGLLTGARSDREIIRSGENEALVEGIFTVDNEATRNALTENEVEPEDDGTVTVTRRISRDGRSSAKINGRNVPLARLRAAASALISIHGQQDTQAFADRGRQLKMLDLFAKNEAERAVYGEEYAARRATLSAIEKLDTDAQEKAYRTDMLKYRIAELKEANVKKGEKAKLETERKMLANSEKIISRCLGAYDDVYGRDGSASELIQAAYEKINALDGIIPEANELASRLESAKYEIIDISDALKKYGDGDGADTEQRLDECETRLEAIRRLESKYRRESDGFPALLEEWQSELDAIENSDEELEKLRKTLAVQEKELSRAADELRKTRSAAAKTLCLRVTEELAALDMPKVTFTVDFTEKEPAPDGADEAEFLISANKGEEPKPMSKIASGGELSRIMLCLKCVFADVESIGTLIFDEIDSGVSGGTSEKIGLRLKKASDGGKTQVICVTHSAIIASISDAHYKISKSVIGERTETSVELLDGDGRVNELARIMGGVSPTETVVNAAKELLAKNRV